MFERFTEKAIKAIMLAQEESRQLGHNFVGTGQILLGLIGEETGVAAKLLKAMGVSLNDARIEVEKKTIIGHGSIFIAAEIPFTPRAKGVLDLSLEKARKLGHNWIGTEHLLLGLVQEGESVAARVLETLGVDLSKVPPALTKMLCNASSVMSDDPVETKRRHIKTYKCSYCSNEDKIISDPYKCEICDNSKFILIEDIYIQRVTHPS